MALTWPVLAGRYSEQPEQYEYLPSLIALTEWGDRWAAPEAPPILYRHRNCGSDAWHEVVCSTCGQVEDPVEVDALPGPCMPAERAEHAAAPRCLAAPPVATPQS